MVGAGGGWVHLVVCWYVEGIWEQNDIGGWWVQSVPMG